MNRLLLRSLLGAGVLSVAAAGALAQSYPVRPVTVIAPFAPGASADAMARAIARELSQSLGQPVVVDNKPGAGGATGLLVVANAKPDGYTLGIGATGAIAISPHLPDAPPLNPPKQLQPLAKLANIPLVVAASEKSGLTTLRALLDQAKTGDVAMGNAGQYTAHHLSGELLAGMSKTRLTAVPYRGSAPAVTDLLGGQITSAIVDLTSVAAHIDSGKVKALAVTSAKRSTLAPKVPTVAEAGVPGYVGSAWMGLFAPKGLSPAVSERLSSALKLIMEKPEVQQKLLELAVEPDYLDARQFDGFIDAESKRWASVIGSLPKPQKP